MLSKVRSETMRKMWLGERSSEVNCVVHLVCFSRLDNKIDYDNGCILTVELLISTHYPTSQYQSLFQLVHPRTGTHTHTHKHKVFFLRLDAAKLSQSDGGRFPSAVDSGGYVWTCYTADFMLMRFSGVPTICPLPSLKYFTIAGSPVRQDCPTIVNYFNLQLPTTPPVDKIMSAFHLGLSTVPHPVDAHTLLVGNKIHIYTGISSGLLETCMGD